MVQLEELESQFGEFDQFLGDILTKREELLEAFETHKQALLDDRQRKAQSVADAAARILEGLGRLWLAGVPIRHDPPTARALHAAVDLGEEIRPEHYKAVAAAIRFAHGLRKTPGKRGAQ